MLRFDTENQYSPETAIDTIHLGFPSKLVNIEHCVVPHIKHSIHYRHIVLETPSSLPMLHFPQTCSMWVRGTLLLAQRDYSTHSAACLKCGKHCQMGSSKINSTAWFLIATTTAWTFSPFLADFCNKKTPNCSWMTLLLPMILFYAEHIKLQLPN